VVGDVDKQAIALVCGEDGTRRNAIDRNGRTAKTIGGHDFVCDIEGIIEGTGNSGAGEENE
jgi:hypothetical protein